jgi:biotin transport system substrate-specific component
MAVALGDVVIYTVGITQLSFVAGLGVKKALLVGFLPFVLGDSLKCLVAGLLAKKIRTQPFWPRGFEST